jgi:hypothetical protein
MNDEESICKLLGEKKPIYNEQHRLWQCLFILFYCSLAILCYSQSGNDQQEDLAKFGYKLNMKLTISKHPSIFFGYFT